MDDADLLRLAREHALDGRCGRSRNGDDPLGALDCVSKPRPIPSAEHDAGGDERGGELGPLDPHEIVQRDDPRTLDAGRDEIGGPVEKIKP